MTKKILTWLEAFTGTDPKVLMLWTFPSDESLKEDFYYKGSRNSFWKIIWKVFWIDDLGTKTNDEKRTFLVENGIALWDIFETAERNDWSSTDKNTKWLKYNDIKWLVEDFDNIKYLIVHSQEAEKELKKYFEETKWDFPYKYITSPSNNNSKPVEKKVKQWKTVFSD